ncbi:asparagine synthase (glutamine-hydrolyzing) [Paraburkholderia sediminicola]|uniref:asparagine synthase (glutamine-hydrolyzing) n=1 Tax=Paraburkholderia sediminicola TaxID=458836 RepID=UPI0038B82001
MCGITGFLTRGLLDEAASLRHLRNMCDSIQHRGPDDSGYWVDAHAGVALGHRRLAIVDLSAQGHQPMISACGRYVIVYNGEIYNFGQLRKKLDALANPPVWRGHSDTEVLLASIAEWGIKRTLQTVCGMFAFALWDRDERVLTLVRDPLGEKPLYYGWMGNTFLFGSELKALRQHPTFSAANIDRDALCLYMRYNSIPAPYTIYTGVSKLMPGTVATVSPDRTNVTVETYWSLNDAVARGRANPFAGSESDAVVVLNELLRTVISEQMVADVALGAFLSGGIDSSTIVALMQAQTGRPIKTFTIGFDHAGFDEAEHAKSVARHLGTEHHELYATAADALNVVPVLSQIYDEPFADSSQIPTFLVSQMTRRHVTVSLSGDGGDELFGGYNRHVAAQGLWNRLDSVPLSARHFAAHCIKGVRREHLDRMAAPLLGLLPKNRRQAQVGDKLHKLADVMGADSLEAFYARLVSTFDAPEQIVLTGKEPLIGASWAEGLPSGLSNAERMMYLDTLQYLPTDILTKVDRAGMRVSLETRIPFLDRRVVEFAWTIPLSMKVRDGKGKQLLRKLLDLHVPRQLIDRPKQGFAVPIAAWLRGELREWASDLLDGTRLRNEGFFNASAVESLWRQHLAGTHNWQNQLWAILMFEAWLDANGQVSPKSSDLSEMSQFA